jgi:hypothetical protein
LNPPQIALVEDLVPHEVKVIGEGGRAVELAPRR